MTPRLVLACSLALGLAACGGSGGAGGGGRTVTIPAPSTTTAPATTATTSPTTPATTTTTASTSSGACTAHDVSLVFVGQQGAAGHGEIAFALKNTGSAPCHTFGFPGIQFLDRSGGPLATIPHHTTSDYFGHAPEGTLTVAPGQEVSFRLGVTHGAVPGSVCSTAYGLAVIPPDDTESVRTTIPGGAYECRDATVSPLQPGTSAYR